MGLDVSAYARAQFMHDFDSPDHDPDSCADREDVESIYAAVPASFNYLDGMPEGCYQVPINEGDKFHFRAGSYSGYNAWREILSYLVLGAAPIEVWEYPSIFKDKLAFELVRMADNEGSFGPVTSQKLAKDLEMLRPEIAYAYEKAAHHFGFSRWAWDKKDWLNQFDRFHQAFKLASRGGVVVFG